MVYFQKSRLNDIFRKDISKSEISPPDKMKKSQNPPKKQKLFKEEKPKKSNIPEIKPPVTKGMWLFKIIFKGHYDTKYDIQYWTNSGSKLK